MNRPYTVCPQKITQGTSTTHSFSTLEKARNFILANFQKFGECGIYNNVGRGWWDEADKKRNLIEWVKQTPGSEAWQK